MCTAILHNGNGIPGHLSKAKVPAGGLRVAVSAAVKSQHSMICTQALGQAIALATALSDTLGLPRPASYFCSSSWAGASCVSSTEVLEGGGSPLCSVW